MVNDMDIYRTAKVLVELHGEDAPKRTTFLLSSPISMYHFVAEFLALVVSCLRIDADEHDCTV